MRSLFLHGWPVGRPTNLSRVMSERANHSEPFAYRGTRKNDRLLQLASSANDRPPRAIDRQTDCLSVCTFVRLTLLLLKRHCCRFLPPPPPPSIHVWPGSVGGELARPNVASIRAVGRLRLTSSLIHRNTNIGRTVVARQGRRRLN